MNAPSPASSPRTSRRQRTGLIRFHWIGKAATKQVSKLDNVTREMVIQSFASQRWEFCTDVKGHAWRNVWHYPIGNSFRVTFFVRAGETTVLHVGPHDEFEQYADHGTRCQPNRRLPMMEFLMKSRHQSPAESVSSPAREQSVPESPPMSPEHALGQALLQSVSPLLENLVSDLRSRMEKCTDQLEKVEYESFGFAEDAKQQIADHATTAQLTELRLQEQMTSLQSVWDSRLEQLHEKLRGEVADCELSLVSELRRLASGVDSGLARSDAALNDVGRQAEAIRGDLQSVQEALLGRLHAQSEVQMALESVEQRLARLEEQSVQAYLNRVRGYLQTPVKGVMRVVGGVRRWVVRRLIEPVARQRA